MGFGSKRVYIFFVCEIVSFAFCSQTKKNFKPRHINWGRRLIDNFHTVEKNKLYRSRQLSAKLLRRYIARYNIKTIINLRGPNPQELWWHNEKKEAEYWGVALYHIPMSAQTMPNKEHITSLLGLFKSAQKPILIHCKSGADRTGEAAALWVIEQQKKSKKSALKQLSLKYWHLSSQHPLKRKFIKLWQGLDWFMSDYSLE